MSINRKIARMTKLASEIIQKGRTKSGFDTRFQMYKYFLAAKQEACVAFLEMSG